MTEILHNLFHMVDEWTDRQSMSDPQIQELSARQDALQEEIIRRLGEDGREMMESLINLNLQLENIRVEVLCRAAMQLGAQIASPGGVYSTSR